MYLFAYFDGCGRRQVGVGARSDEDTAQQEFVSSKNTITPVDQSAAANFQNAMARAAERQYATANLKSE